MLNNKINTILLSGLMMMVFTLTSCKKDGNSKNKTSADITITAPTEMQTFEQNATVNITGTIAYADGLHGYQLIIRKKSDNSVTFQKDEHAHGASINFNQSWVNNLDGHNDMELEVIAIIDHEGNTTSKKLTFHCHGH